LLSIDAFVRSAVQADKGMLQLGRLSGGMILTFLADNAEIPLLRNASWRAHPPSSLIMPALERFPKSVMRFSDKKRDQTNDGRQAGQSQ
jgi:hypothetical protein